MDNQNTLSHRGGEALSSRQYKVRLIALSVISPLLLAALILLNIYVYKLSGIGGFCAVLGISIIVAVLVILVVIYNTKSYKKALKRETDQTE
ncbi:MAG: hypothetical protein K2N22_02750 [Clostridia bacterium]|nr:hypothetical protein [Clostridia bacterium]